VLHDFKLKFEVIMKKEVILDRINHLLKLNVNEQTEIFKQSYQLYMGCVTIVSQLYGPTSIQMQALKEEKARLMGLAAYEHAKSTILINELHGLLQTITDEVAAGLVQSVQDEARGEIYADFIALAKRALDDKSKDVAAVLAAAALEDALKRYAESRNLEPMDKDMSEVIALLKGNHLLQKPEAKVLQAYVTLRNKALHAEWDKINSPEVSSLIGFVENFVLIHFSGSFT
jgi:uncharacterized protein YutE (UPF0331/DUF86 family)